MEKNKKYAGQFAVITGASSGIGYELAKQFAQNGFDILITSKDPAHIEKAKKNLHDFGVSISTFAADLATCEGIDRLYAEIKSKNRPIDAIAINAGIGVYGEFKDTNLDEEHNLINLNIMCPVHLSKLVIKDMLAQGEGKILFTASVAGTMPGPLMAVYNASKAFLLSFSYALREELKDTGVSVTALLPGATETNFFKRADMEHSKIGQMKKQPASEVAEAGFKALMSEDSHVVSGIGNKIQTAIGEILPETYKARKEHEQAKPDSGAR
jgi:short-subunit dehydrogenase